MAVGVSTTPTCLQARRLSCVTSSAKYDTATGDNGFSTVANMPHARLVYDEVGGGWRSEGGGDRLLNG